MSHENFSSKIVETEPLKWYFMAVNAFFDFNQGISGVRKNLKKLLYRGFSKDFLLKDDLPELYSLRKDFTELIKNTFAVHEDKSLYNLPVVQDISNDTGYMKSSLYCGHPVQNALEEWHCFPRHLCKKEFMNPSLAIREFFTYKPPSGWNVLLEALLGATLSRESIVTSLEDVEHPLLLHNYLSKFIEASHLMMVREDDMILAL